jgi:hypothetical protein
VKWQDDCELLIIKHVEAAAAHFKLLSQHFVGGNEEKLDYNSRLRYELQIFKLPRVVFMVFWVAALYSVKVGGPVL